MNQMAHCFPVAIVSRKSLLFRMVELLLIHASRSRRFRNAKNERETSSYFAILFAFSVVEEKYEKKRAKNSLELHLRGNFYNPGAVIGYSSRLN